MRAVGRGIDGIRRKIHIRKTGDPAPHIFGDLQHRPPVDVVGRQVLFQGEDALVQPRLEGKIVRRAAEQAHRRVRMRVAKAAHQKIALAVDLPLGYKGRIGAADADDRVAVRPHLPFDDLRVGRGEDLRVIEAQLHRFPPPCPCNVSARPSR